MRGAVFKLSQDLTQRTSPDNLMQEGLLFSRLGAIESLISGSFGPYSGPETRDITPCASCG
jgi:hypothetical protein